MKGGFAKRLGPSGRGAIDASTPLINWLRLSCRKSGRRLFDRLSPATFEKGFAEISP